MELVWHYIPSKLFIFLHFCIVPPCFTTGPLVPCQTHQISGVPGVHPLAVQVGTPEAQQIEPSLPGGAAMFFFPVFAHPFGHFGSWFILIIHPDSSCLPWLMHIGPIILETPGQLCGLPGHLCPIARHRRGQRDEAKNILSVMDG